MSQHYNREPLKSLLDNFTITKDIIIKTIAIIIYCNICIHITLINYTINLEKIIDVKISLAI